MGLFGSTKEFGQMANVASGGGSTAGLTSTGAQTGLRTVGTPALTGMIAKPGQLSPYLKANVAAERRGILGESEAAKQAALKGAAYRGLGGPSGAASSAENVITRGRQTADTDALQRAYGQQAGLNLQATQGLAGIGTGYGSLQNEYMKNQLAALQAKDAAWSKGLGSIMGMASAAAGGLSGGMGGGMGGLV